MRRVRTSENFAEDKNVRRRYFRRLLRRQKISLLLVFKVFLDILDIFAEDCFLLRSFRKFLPSGFLPFSCFPSIWGGCGVKNPRQSLEVEELRSRSGTRALKAGNPPSVRPVVVLKPSLGRKTLEKRRRAFQQIHFWRFAKRTDSRWTFRIFFIFFCSGEEKGESRATGRGGSVFIENPRRGGGLPGGGGGPGRVSPAVCREFGGGC